MMKILPDAMILPARTLTGRGIVCTLLEHAVAFGTRGMLVHGASLRMAGFLDKILANSPAGLVITPVEHAGGEPTLSDLVTLLATARRTRVDWVAAVGGGSVLDLAKACAGLLHATGPIEEYHNGGAVEPAGVPFFAAPTTAGTGSEATINAVLTNMCTGEKKSIRQHHMMARLVLLDADLLDACPQKVRAHAGLDALTQAIEVYFCREASWISDDFARRGFELLAGALPKYASVTPAAGCCKTCADATEKMLLGSYYAGLALSIARLGIVHGIAHPLGARYKISHGQVCGVCLPLALEFNRDAVVERYAALSALVGTDLREWVVALLGSLAVQNPFAGQALRETDGIIRATLNSASGQANPRPLTANDVRWMLDKLFAPTH